MVAVRHVAAFAPYRDTSLTVSIWRTTANGFMRTSSAGTKRAVLCPSPVSAGAPRGHLKLPRSHHRDGRTCRLYHKIQAAPGCQKNCPLFSPIVKRLFLGLSEAARLPRE